MRKECILSVHSFYFAQWIFFMGFAILIVAVYEKSQLAFDTC